MKKLIILLTLILVCGLFLTSCVDNGTDDGSGNPPAGVDGPDVDGEWDPTATVLPVKGGRSGIVVLIHDDGIWSTAVTLDKLYHEYGLVGDVAMLSYKLYDTATGTEKSDELTNWRALMDTERWKIVSHSHTHTWWGTTTENEDGTYTFLEDEDKMREEIVGSQEILRNLFPGQRVLTFAYPGFTKEKNYVDNVADKIFELIYSEKSRKMLNDTYISARSGLGLSLSVTTPTLHWSRHYLGKVYASENAWNYFPAFGFSDSNIDSGKLFKIVDGTTAKALSVLYTHKVVDELTGGSNEMTTEAMRSLCEYLSAKVKSGEIWNAHYEDAVLYVREATASRVKLEGDENMLTVSLTDTLDDEIYNYPLTVRVNVPKEWKAAKITHNGEVFYAVAEKKDDEWVIDFDIVPDLGDATVVPVPESDVPKVEEPAKKPPVNAAN